jgi:CelD/BcsL family acetyltransferase involved in cellulose biosynthesis
MADSDDLTVRVIRDAAGLQAVREAWRALAATLDECCFVHLYGVVREPFRGAPGGRGVVARGHPLAKRDARGGAAAAGARRSVAGLRVRVLESAEVEGPLHDVLLSGDLDGARVVTACRTQLPRDPLLAWDVMRLHGVLHGRQAAGLAQRLAGWPGLTVSRTFSNYIDVSDERCFARLSAKQRYRLRRHRRSLEDSGHLEFVTVTLGPGIEAAFDELVAVEASGWKSQIRGQRALKLNPERLRFYAALRERLACHVHLMRLNGETLAGALIYTVSDTAYEFKIGRRTLPAGRSGTRAEGLHRPLLHRAARHPAIQLHHVLGLAPQLAAGTSCRERLLSVQFHVGGCVVCGMDARPRMAE